MQYVQDELISHMLIRVFHKCTKLAIMPLLSTLYIHIFAVSIFIYLQHMILINIKLHFGGCNRITFQGCRLHWFDSFLMAQSKRSWQYCHTCIRESL